MRITSLRLENFRTYKQITLIEDLKGLNIFIGPNNSGKSNILYALQFLHDLSKGRLNSDVFRKGINENNLDEEIVIEVIVSLSDSERNILMKRIRANHLVNKLLERKLLGQIKYFVKLNQYGTICEELSILNNRGEFSNIIVNSQGEQKTTRISNLKETIKGMTSTASFDALTLDKVTTWLPEWIMLKTLEEDRPLEYEVAELIKSYFGTIINLGTLENRDHPGAFISSLGSLKDNNWRQFTTIATTVEETLGFSNLSFSGNRLNIKENKRIKMTPFEALSDGSKELLHVISRIVQSSLTSRIICIEEPETHLHSSHQKSLMQKIKEISTELQIQFFITTHSPLFTSINGDSNT